jgi:hypothetical protein
MARVSKIPKIKGGANVGHVFGYRARIWYCHQLLFSRVKRGRAKRCEQQGAGLSSGVPHMRMHNFQAGPVCTALSGFFLTFQTTQGFLKDVHSSG